MRGVASAQVSPGARTCIVLGALDAVEGVDLRPYKFVMWFAPRAAQLPARFGVDSRAVVREALEEFDHARTGEALERFIGKDVLRLPTLILTDDAAGPLAGPFLPVVDEILAQFEGIQRARATRQADGFVWQLQLLGNVPAYLRARVPASWAGALEGVPALVCGAGPSLDASLPKLAQVAPHGVVFAADSALRGLTEYGVTADFAFTIDARKTPEKCLGPGVNRPERLLLTTVSPAGWRERISPDRQYFLSGRQVTEDWLAEKGFAKTRVAAVENCGIAALELAAFMGCAPIYLFGLDHAVDAKDPTKWHQQSVADGMHDHIGFSAEKKYPKVPGNYQPEIATPLFREWRTLDALCAGYPAGLVTNVIDRGAKLRNTTLVHPDDFAMSTGRIDRAERLGALSAADPAANVAETIAELRNAAVKAEPAIRQARQAVAGKAAGEAIALLASAYQDAAFRKLMGNYCLKIMPHLLQPDAKNTALWDTLVSETEQLIAAAKALR